LGQAGDAGARVALKGGVVQEILHEGKIAVFSGVQATREAVDGWVEGVITYVKAWPVERVCLLMHDFSTARALLTPYAQSRVQELIRSRPDLVGFISIVVPRNISGQAVRLFMGMQKLPPKLVNQVHFTRDEGFRWLLDSYARAQAERDAVNTTL
jgi:hypothetical protein